MPQPVCMNQEGFGQEESKPQVGRAVDIHHASTVRKAEQGEMGRMGLGLEARKHFPKEKATRSLEGTSVEGSGMPF